MRGVARWQDFDLEIDWHDYLAAAERLRLDGNHLRVAGWERRTRRQYGERIPVVGFTGPLELAGDLTLFLALLAIGETTHIGNQAALGMGRYALSLY